MKKLLLSLALATVVATPSLALAKTRMPADAGVTAAHGVVQPWGAVATDPDPGIRFELNREAQEGIS